MRADSIATSNIKNRIGSKGSLEKVADVRLLLEEKRQNNTGPRQPNSIVKSGNFITHFWTELSPKYIHFTPVLHCRETLHSHSLSSLREVELGIALGKNQTHFSGSFFSDVYFHPFPLPVPVSPHFVLFDLLPP